MAEFKVIQTQEEFDEAIRDRLRREREKYADYDEVKRQNGEYATQIATLTSERDAARSRADELETTAKNREVEALRTRIALENGLPIEAAVRLTGDTEEAIKTDAAALAKLFADKRPTPRKNMDPVDDDADGKKTGLRSLSQALLKEE